MTLAGGIALIVVGAILAFALKSGSVYGLDLQIVGVILMLAGVAGLVLTMLVRNRSRADRLPLRSRRTVVVDDPALTVEDPYRLQG